MRKIPLLIVSLVIYGILPAQFKVNDTLFFIREINDSLYHRVFIDTNKKSVFYTYVSDFNITGFDIDTYRMSLSYLYSKKLHPTKQDLTNIPREWIMLETYKGQIYVYSPADYYNHYKVKITDSVWIDWTGEGPEATYIQKFSRPTASSYQFTLQSQMYPHREILIQYINEEKGIALFEIKQYNSDSKKKETSYCLMADVRKIRNIPLLVNTCDYQKQNELEFDIIDYAKKGWQWY
ncbi:MAG: hypothetical protein HYU70_05880 [Bacteroidetes bacterium]|nr:hypothetical protein [Bacteroidota bacterium]